MTERPSPQRRLLLLALLGLSAALATGCGSSRPTAESSPPLDLAPQPYTAAQLAASHPPGTYTLYRISAAGQPTMQRRTVWTACDSEGCSMDNFDWPADAPDEQNQTLGRASWEELRDHASFPAALTERSTETIEVGAGRFECWLYRFSELEATPTAADGSQVPAPVKAENLFWFSKQSAGSPVRYQVRVGSEVVFEMELLETNRQNL